MKTSYFLKFMSLVVPVLVLTSCSKTDYSTEIAAQNGLNDLYVYDLDSNTNIKITDSPEEVELFHLLSPDGSKIAYLDDKGRNLFTIGLDGSAKKKVYTFKNYGGFDWMSDSKGFVVFDEGILITIDADGSGSSLLLETDLLLDSPKMSPDGSKIIATSYDELESELHLITPSGEIETLLKGGRQPIILGRLILTKFLTSNMMLRGGGYLYLFTILTQKKKRRLQRGLLRYGDLVPTKFYSLGFLMVVIPY